MQSFPPRSNSWVLDGYRYSSVTYEHSKLNQDMFVDLMMEGFEPVNICENAAIIRRNLKYEMMDNEQMSYIRKAYDARTTSPLSFGC